MYSSNDLTTLATGITLQTCIMKVDLSRHLARAHFQPFIGACTVATQYTVSATDLIEAMSETSCGSSRQALQKNCT